MLRVWLPLTKDLRQQGLSNVTVTNNGATYSATGGKLGGCYVLDGSNDRIQISNLPQPQNISIAMWFKRGANTNTRQFLFTAWNGITLELSTSGTVTCSVATADGQVGYCNTNTAITTSTGWTHICFTFENGVGTKLYINGVFQTATAVAKPISWSTTTGNIGYFSTYLNASVNDFRLYDHALSRMEVKELAKGLVLHYPLNRQGWGQENLLKNSNFLQGTNGMEGYTATSATCTKQIDCMKVVSTSTSGGFYTSNFNNITTGDMTIFSADVKADNNMTIYIGTDGSGNGSCQAYTIGTSWQRISISKAKTTNNANLRIYGNGTFYAKNLKYELGSIATPWCPNSSDTLATTMGLNGTIEYDCSGFCNNGTRSGVTYSSDTPKYQVSTVFDTGTDTVTVAPCYSVGQTIDTMTCAIWFKTNTLNSTAPNQVSLGENAFFRFRIATATSIWYYIRVGSTQCGSTFSCKTLTDNNWHHVVVVFDKGYVYVYIDGNIIGTGNHTSTATYMTCNSAGTTWHLAGYSANSENFIGSESDFRIYATALSADDVKSLYQNSAYIDNSGNVYGAVHSEV